MNSPGYLGNPPLLYPPPLRGEEIGRTTHISSSPRWEEVGRRGFLSFLGGPQGNDKLDIPALKELDKKQPEE
jgi:hypothetical protein